MLCDAFPAIEHCEQGHVTLQIFVSAWSVWCYGIGSDNGALKACRSRFVRRGRSAHYGRMSTADNGFNGLWESLGAEILKTETPARRRAPDGAEKAASGRTRPLGVAFGFDQRSPRPGAIACNENPSLACRSRWTLDDLIAYGQLGLAEAAQKFDAESGVRFTTFAYYRVRGAIYDGVSKMNWTSRAQTATDAVSARWPMTFSKPTPRRIQTADSKAMPADRLPRSRAAKAAVASDDVDWLGRMTERLAVVYLASSDEDSPKTNVLSQAPGRVTKSPAKSLQTAKCKSRCGNWWTICPPTRND